MAYALVAILLGGGVGLALGGRIHNLGEHRLAGWLLLPAGIVLQVLSARTSGGAGLALMAASYVALMAFAAANYRIAGMALVVVGLALNLVVIAVNDGMPVRSSAVVRAGIADNVVELRELKPSAKHHYEHRGDRLMVLADVLPVRPLREVLSIGDVVMSLGIAIVVSTLVRKEPTHPQAEPSRSLPSER